jgi:hypothetical protein
MLRQLHELSKEELVQVVQDYQEMVSDLEEFAYNLMTVEGYETGDAIQAILYKERPGWEIHKHEKLEGFDPTAKRKKDGGTA